MTTEIAKCFCCGRPFSRPIERQPWDSFCPACKETMRRKVAEAAMTAWRARARAKLCKQCGDVLEDGQCMTNHNEWARR